jgi:hypothetical protein
MIQAQDHSGQELQVITGTQRYVYISSSTSSGLISRGPTLGLAFPALGSPQKKKKIHTKSLKSKGFLIGGYFLSSLVLEVVPVARSFSCFL